MTYYAQRKSIKNGEPQTINNRYGKKQIVLAPTLTRGDWAPQLNHLATQSKTLHFYTGMSPRYIGPYKPMTQREEDDYDTKQEKSPVTE